MRRGTTPTLTFLLPADASLFDSATLFLTQNGLSVLTVGQDRLIAEGKTLSLTLTENESLLFEPWIPAEVQLRLTTPQGTVLRSEIRRLAIRPLIPDDPIPQ